MTNPNSEVPSISGEETKLPRKSNKYSKKQLKILILFGIANVFSGTIVSIQAPFYPKEAEDRGASATEYGLVMGVFQLVMFIMSTVYGCILGYVNPRVLFNLGIFITSVCAILFGCLDYVTDHTTFIAVSFLLRILQASGDAGFVTVSFTIIATEFPDCVGSTFATFSTCFGVGQVIGPGVGGVLYEVGGFMLPFSVMGGCLLAVSVLTYFLLPQMGESLEASGEDMTRYKSGFISLICTPIVALAYFSVVITATGTGFLVATLEPHLRENFGLTPGYTGLMFILEGGAFAISAPIWGRFVDKTGQPKIFTLVGGILTFTAFLFIGPAPFIPLPTLLWLTIVGLILQGLGSGASCVSAFTQASKGAVENGFSDNVSTYGLVSGLWMSCFAMGAFVGPSVGGILLDHFGFKLSSIFVLITQVFVILSTSLFIFAPKLFKKSKSYKNMRADAKISNSENQSLLKNDYSPLATDHAWNLKASDYGAL